MPTIGHHNIFKQMNSRIYILSVFILAFAGSLTAQEWGLRGQLSNYYTLNPKEPIGLQTGLRYIPELTFKTKLTEKLKLDFEISANSYVAGTKIAQQDWKTATDLKPYRAWARISTNQAELRLGLQKINFGSAYALRPLMWFDALDPNDPLQLTDGVYAALFRYYFNNNANIWLWGLYGNENTKGWEAFETTEKMPEVGGRVQLPLPIGEIAVSYHFRKANLIDYASSLADAFVETPENRLAIDFKVDAFVGLWAEGSVVNQKNELFGYNYKRYINLGTDYTFNLGTGLTAMTEYFYTDLAKDLTGEVLENPITGKAASGAFQIMSLSYAVGLMDNISVMAYYDYGNKEWYRFVNYQRTYDRLSFYVMGFWNPETFNITPGASDGNLFSGLGGQLMLVFNH